ncbi:unnamed protein product [Candida verbasci]|uniref:MHF histone-fold complex subunit 1 n=1 Tax=Candida verbasci TaxID=1227364 RepID=A0A9W4TV56_9ASCO|nr:unnamed protein product [Candida verbasci]
MAAKQSKEEISLQLKSAVYLSVAKIVEDQVKQLNLSDNSNVTATPTFIAQLVELVFNQIINLGEDLESFANHANRDIVDLTDLYMVTRKNPSLKKYLKDLNVKK